MATGQLALSCSRLAVVRLASDDTCTFIEQHEFTATGVFSYSRVFNRILEYTAVGIHTMARIVARVREYVATGNFTKVLILAGELVRLTFNYTCSALYSYTTGGVFHPARKLLSAGYRRLAWYIYNYPAPSELRYTVLRWVLGDRRAEAVLRPRFKRWHAPRQETVAQPTEFAEPVKQRTWYVVPKGGPWKI